MAESLKDQLIRAGLKASKPANKAARKQAIKRQPPVRDSGSDLAKAYKLRKSEQERQKRNRQQKKLADESQRREINRQLRALVEAHGIRDPKADIARNFMFKGRIRRVLVNKQRLCAVNSGELVIVYLAGSYHLVPAEKAELVNRIAPDHLPDLAAEQNPEEVEYPVPDDLVW